MVARKRTVSRKRSVYKDKHAGDLQWRGISDSSTRGDRQSPQWRVANSLLLIAVGLMLFGYGWAMAGEQAATGMIIIPPNFGGMIGMSPGLEWADYMHSIDRTAHAAITGPEFNTVKYFYDYSQWSTELTNPIVAEGKVFFGTTDGRVVAADWTTGEWVFEWSASGTDYPTNIAYSSGMVFAATNDNYIIAFNSTTGEDIWSYRIAGNNVQPYELLPVGSWLIFSANDGQLYSLSMKDGTEKWKGNMTVSNNPGIQCMPITAASYYAANSRIYFGTQNCGISSYDIDGNEKNKGSGYDCLTMPVIYNDTFYYQRSNGRFYADDSGMSTKFNLELNAVRPPAVTNDGRLLMVAAKTGDAYSIKAVRTITEGANGPGSIAWSTDVSGAITEAPSVDKTKVYFGTNDGKLHALKISDGSEVWSYATGATWISAPAPVTPGIAITTNTGKMLMIGIDSTPPTIVNGHISTSAPNYGDIVTVKVNFSDNSGLDRAILEVTEGAAAPRNVSTVPLSGTFATATFQVTANQPKGTVVKMRIYCFDTSGNAYTSSSDPVYTVYETLPPVITSVGQSSGTIGVGGTNMLTATITDNAGIDRAVLYTNETGKWKEYNGTYGSPKNLSGAASATASFSWKNATLKVGNTVFWKIVAFDTSGNNATSGNLSFEIVKIIVPPKANAPPVAESVSQSAAKIEEGEAIEFYAKWSDDAGLSRAELWAGKSGTIQELIDQTVLGGKSDWSNFTYAPEVKGGTTMTWQVRAYDSDGLPTETNLQSFVVSKKAVTPITTTNVTPLTQINQSTDEEPYTELPIAYMLFGGVLVGIGAASLVFYKKQILEKVEKLKARKQPSEPKESEEGEEPG